MASTSGMTLDQLVEQLRLALAASLRSVVLYGSAASGEAVPGRSDQNVLVIVNRLETVSLRSLAQTARAWKEAGNPVPLILTFDEWRTSADIFAIEYSDILERNRVLFGDAPFEGIRVRASDLRLQVEREAMGKLLRLRAGVMAVGTDTKRQSALLTDSLSTLMVIFRSVLRLVGEVPSRDYETVVRAVASRAGFDATPFVQVIGAQRNTKPLVERDTEAILSAYVAGMERLVSYLDGLDLPDEPT